jgi:hypothetical protein
LRRSDGGHVEEYALKPPENGVEASASLAGRMPSEGGAQRSGRSLDR